MRTLGLLTAVLFTSIAIVPAALAQTSGVPASAIDSTGSDAIPALPVDVQSSNGVSYISGGIGDEELSELKAKASDFNLHVMLSTNKGDYIGDVTLCVLDSKGTKLVSVNEAGPYFYAHLKPGNYTLEASAEGTTKKVNVKIGKGTAKKQIVFSEPALTTNHVPTTKLD